MLREYLERWLAHMATQVSPRSAENYREVVEHWIVPALGNIKLAKLQPEQIAQAYSDALTKGGKDGKGLSPRSVGMMHRTLSQSLKHAVIWRLRGDNPNERLRKAVGGSSFSRDLLKVSAISAHWTERAD
jgi:glycosyltransferase A (GT-A) superfamily protein (DUF2064 family)